MMNQKNIKKRFFSLLLIVCITVTGFNVGKLETYASAKDVTNSAFSRYGVRNLVKCFSTFCGAELTYHMKVGQKKKYDFSKESIRRHTLNHCYKELYGELNAGSSANKLSKQIFGKGTSKIKFTIGDLGDGEYPEFKIQKIYKLSSQKYKINFNVIQFPPYVQAKYRKTGELSMVLKKKQDSLYGYIVKSMTLRRTPASVINRNTAPNWKAAYKNVLKNPNMDNYGDILYLEEYFGSYCRFNRYFLCDVDNNKTPELFLYSKPMELSAVFTYRNGKLVYLGYDWFYKINKSKKCLIVHGHWHGGGGSGENEYHIYGIGKNNLKPIHSIDYSSDTVFGKYSVEYEKVYNKYVKGGRKFSSFKKYKLSDMNGLKAQ